MSKTCVVAAGLYCGIGMVIPIAPTIAGIGAACVVRALLWSKKESIKWNLGVMLLSILATFVTLEGQDDTSTFFGFWIGVSYGGMGQGIISMGRSAVVNTFKERFGQAMSVFMGGKPKADEPTE